MAYSVSQVAEKLSVTQRTVWHWIDSGDLKAVDVSRKRGGKPRWRITADALEAFERSRTKAPPPPPTRRRSRKQDPEVIEFIK